MQNKYLESKAINNRNHWNIYIYPIQFSFINLCGFKVDINNNKIFQENYQKKKKIYSHYILPFLFCFKVFCLNFGMFDIWNLHLYHIWIGFILFCGYRASVNDKYFSKFHGKWL